jgi:glutamyl-tRNA synthetase
MSGVRTRFAPSPTGALHVGGVRTALFSYLHARHTGGRFILRIEDTDLKRSRREWVDEIMSALQWLGIEWDEGPYFQSERTDVYRAAIDRLVASGHAYPCSCSAEELEERRAAARESGGPAGYDGRCRPGQGAGPIPGRPTSIRFAIPRPGETIIDDLVKGQIRFQNSEIDDFVIARSDGSPTFNLVVTVDDAEMGMTHVIRGDDHVANTAKQVHIYRALGAPLPVFAHLPQVLGPDGSRLSKRHAATAVTEYRDLGFYPDALVNFVARLGWSHGDQEVFTRAELVQAFALENVGASAGVFNLEKLRWLNFQYLKARTPEQLAADLREFNGRRGVEVAFDDRRLARVAETLRDRAQTLLDLSEQAAFYFSKGVEIEPAAAAKVLRAEAAPILRALLQELEALSSWDQEALQAAFSAVVSSTGSKLGAIAQPARVALVGRTASPGIYDVMEILGRDESLDRLRVGIGVAAKNASESAATAGESSRPT